MQKYKSKLIILLYIIAIIIFAFCFYYGMIKHQNNILNDFKIKKIIPKDGLIYYDFEPNSNAIKYEIIISQNNKKIVETVTENAGYLKTSFNYKDQIIIEVFAYNNLKEFKKSNKLDFVWNYPSFSEDNNIYINKNQTILVDGNLKDKSYKMVLEYEDNIIYEKKLNERINDLNYDLVKNYTGRIKAYVLENNVKIASKYFYVNTNMIEKVVITSPSKEKISYEDFYFIYEGGKNSDIFILDVYENKIKVNSFTLNTNEVRMKIDDFNDENIYTLVLTAKNSKYEDLYTTAEISFKIDSKDKVSPVYTNTDFLTLKPGNKLSLYTNSLNTNIYYKMDNEEFIEYKEPILISKDSLIKAVAIRKDGLSSVENTFDVKVTEKVPVIYLSPSNQYGNYGVSSVGYSNEKIMMNKVTDIVYQKLKANGIKVYRNNPNNDMSYWINESNYVKSDLHLAIHSNGSIDHTKKGVEVYVNDSTSPSYSVAQMIYNNIYELYPYKSAETNKGVMYAEGMMGEVNPINVKMGVLIEIAYHDDINDAKWIVDNITPIAETITDAIINYYQK